MSISDQAAKLFHSIWVNWINHLLSRCLLNDDGSLVIPKDVVERLKSTSTRFETLPDEQKKYFRSKSKAIIDFIVEKY